jgi:hypothetical protein
VRETKRYKKRGSRPSNIEKTKTEVIAGAGVNKNSHQSSDACEQNLLHQSATISALAGTQF